MDLIPPDELGFTDSLYTLSRGHTLFVVCWQALTMQEFFSGFIFIACFQFVIWLIICCLPLLSWKFHIILCVLRACRSGFKTLGHALYTHCTPAVQNRTKKGGFRTETAFLPFPPLTPDSFRILGTDPFLPECVASVGEQGRVQDAPLELAEMARVEFKECRFKLAEMGSGANPSSGELAAASKEQGG